MFIAQKIDNPKKAYSFQEIIVKTTDRSIPMTRVTFPSGAVEYHNETTLIGFIEKIKKQNYFITQGKN